MYEELNTVCREVECRNDLTGIDDEVLTRLDRQFVFLEPLLQQLRPRKHLDAGAVLQSVTRFGPNYSCRILTAVLDDGSGGHPQFRDLEAITLLVLRRVF